MSERHPLGRTCNSGLTAPLVWLVMLAAALLNLGRSADEPYRSSSPARWVHNVEVHEWHLIDGFGDRTGPAVTCEVLNRDPDAVRTMLTASFGVSLPYESDQGACGYA